MFDGRTLEPTYRLRMGAPGRSHALEVAQRLGLGADVIGRAREVMGSGAVQVDELLGRLTEEVDRESEAREKAIGGKIHTFASGLGKWNLKPEDIDIVIHTHLHNDHCENDNLCTNARIYVHEKEMESINDPHPLDYRYDDSFIWDAEDNDQLELVKEDMEIVPGISVMHTPAHTHGGLTVMIDTPAGKAAITGFCVIQENFNPPKAVQALELNVIPPGTHVNVYDSYRILEDLKQKADILLPLHDPQFAAIDTIGNH